MVLGTGSVRCGLVVGGLCVLSRVSGSGLRIGTSWAIGGGYVGGATSASASVLCHRGAACNLAALPGKNTDIGKSRDVRRQDTDRALRCHVAEVGNDARCGTRGGPLERKGRSLSNTARSRNERTGRRSGG